jgi:NADH-quinone oxidoreductase subunit A
MTDLVGHFLLFTVLGVVFLLLPLVLGLFVRPTNPTPQKLTAYECGEPTIGSSYVQFDLRFYVVALLFVIFDVEMAFFFPWAVVFGNAIAEADKGSPGFQQLAWISFVDIAVFFGVLLVGFAYLWKRGDLNWVRSLAGQQKDGV